MNGRGTGRGTREDGERGRGWGREGSEKRAGKGRAGGTERRRRREGDRRGRSQLSGRFGRPIRAGCRAGCRPEPAVSAAWGRAGPAMRRGGSRDCACARPARASPLEGDVPEPRVHGQHRAGASAPCATASLPAPLGRHQTRGRRRVFPVLPSPIHFIPPLPLPSWWLGIEGVG